MRRRATPWGAAAALAALAALAAGVAAPSALARGEVQATIDRWTAANPGTSALVWRLPDNTDGAPAQVAGYRPDSARIPASNMKLVTGAGALIALGPEFRFQTRLVTNGRGLRAGRVLRAPVYLAGSGDPTLATAAYARRYLGATATLEALVRPLRRDGVRVIRGPIVVDERLFDQRRTGPRWRSSYVQFVSPLSALSTNQNFTSDFRGGNAASPALTAAVRLRGALRGAGIHHVGQLRVGQAPTGAQELARVVSPPLRTIVGQMNRPSDNHIAETLVKGVGAYAGRAGTTAAGTAHIGSVLRTRAILNGDDRLVDGSGLSRANALTATSMVRLMAAAEADPSWGRALVGSLPHGGQGTLVRRLRGELTARRVRAKTGYLNGVSALSGRVVSRRGERYAFSILMNTADHRVSAAKATQDRIVTLLAAGRED